MAEKNERIPKKNFLNLQFVLHEPYVERITSGDSYNNELYKLFDDVCASKIIKLKRLQWAGHVKRIDEGSIPKRILYGEIGDRRPSGKPRRRWEDAVKEDSRQILILTGWRKIDNAGEAIFRKSRPDFGLLSHKRGGERKREREPYVE